MQTVRYSLASRTKARWFVLVMGVLLALDAAYTLISYPSYTKYFDYWGMLAAGVLLAAGAIALPKIRPTLMVIPPAVAALVACFSLSTLHWAEIALFFLFLILMVIRMPSWCAVLLRTGGVIALSVGTWATVMPMAERLERLAERGSLTVGFGLPYVIRGLGSDLPMFLAVVVMMFVMRDVTEEEKRGRKNHE